MSSLRLIFDGYWWKRGPVSNAQVMRNIVRAWIHSYPGDELVVFTRKGDVAEVRRELGSAALVRPLFTYPQSVAIRYELPLRVCRRKADMAITHTFSPYRLKCAVFSHDVLFVRHSEWFSKRELAYFRGIASSIKRADIVFSSSRTEGRFINEVDSGRGRVMVVGLGLDPALLSASPRAVPSLTTGSFFLTVGRLNVRKNLDRLVRSLVAGDLISSEFPLVVLGTGGKRMSDVANGRIVWIPSVPVGELRWLYENCAGFICPSLGEGYGLPPVEAAVFGAPVAVSDIPIFRETLGANARYFDPLNEAEIASRARELRSTALEGHPSNPAPGLPRDPIKGRTMRADTWPEVVGRMRDAIACNLD
jgi:glycosyltransferase involved in cell wall biosynthesis